MNQSLEARKLPLSVITSGLLGGHAAVMLLAVLVMGPSTLMSPWGVLLVVLLDLVLLLGLYRTREQTVAHVLLLSWFVIVFFLPRLTMFLIFPAQEVVFVALDPPTSAEIANALVYVVAGTVALLVGFRLGSFIGRKGGPAAGKGQYPLWGILVYVAFCAAAAYFIFFHLQVSIFGEPADWGNPMGWLVRVFDTDAALLLLICWLIVRQAPNRLEVLAVVVAVVAWLVFSLVLGSRGGPVRILLLVGIASFAALGDVRISIRRFSAIMLVAAIASAAIYPVGTIARLAQGGVEAPSAQLFNDWHRPRTVTESVSDMWPARRMLFESQAWRDVAALTAPFFTRLGLIDYTIFIIERPGDPAVLQHYLSPLYGLRNFLNNMVPGEIFANSDIMTSRVFTMAYRGASEEQVRTSFLSEPWTAWGYSWLVGGGWVGGLLLMTLMGAVAQAGYQLVRVCVGAKFAPYAGTAWLFVASTGGVLQFFGLDHALTITAHFSIAMSLGWMCMAGIAALFRRSRAGRTRTADLEPSIRPASTTRYD